MSNVYELVEGIPKEQADKIIEALFNKEEQDKKIAMEKKEDEVFELPFVKKYKFDNHKPVGNYKTISVKFNGRKFNIDAITANDMSRIMSKLPYLLDMISKKMDFKKWDSQTTFIKAIKLIQMLISAMFQDYDHENNCMGQFTLAIFEEIIELTKHDGQPNITMEELVFNTLDTDIINLVKKIVEVNVNNVFFTAIIQRITPIIKPIITELSNNMKNIKNQAQLNIEASGGNLNGG